MIGRKNAATSSSRRESNEALGAWMISTLMIKIVMKTAQLQWDHKVLQKMKQNHLKSRTMKTSQIRKQDSKVGQLKARKAKSRQNQRMMSRRRTQAAVMEVKVI